MKFKVKLKDRSTVEIINLQMQTFRFDVFYLYLLQPIICFKSVLLLTGKIKNHAARDLRKYLL